MLIEAASKALLYAAVLVTVGAAAACWLVPIGAEPAVRRVGLRASVAVSLALLLRGWAHTAATFGLDQSAAISSLWTIMIDSRWGSGWQMQMLAASAGIAAFALTVGGRRVVRVTAAVASAALVVAMTTTGHAAGSPGRMAVHSAHVLGAGLWLGTLTALVSVGRSVDDAQRRAMFRAFSRAALTGAAMVVAAGLVACWWYVGSFSNLRTTAYGRVLLVKIALVGGVVLCGYRNWRAIESGRAEPGRTAMVELVLGALVVVVTGVLTELEHP